MIAFFYTVLTLHLLIILRQGLAILSYQDRSGRQPKENRFAIVIAAHNEYHHLKELIPLLLRQSYENFEIVIALDRCTDRSAGFLKEIHSDRLTFIEIETVPTDFHGKKYALTKAIEKTSMEWILLTDADCRPFTDQWVRSFNKVIRDETEIILGVSPYSQSTGMPGAFIGYETFQTAVNYISGAIKGKPYMGIGRNLAYKRSLFISNNGFSDQNAVTGGDDDLFVQKHAHKHNTHINLCPESLTYSFPKRKWKEYLTQKVRHLSVGKYYRSEFKSSHFLRMSMHFLLWLSFLYLSFNNLPEWRVVGVFSVLLVVKGLFFTRIASKTGTPFSLLWFPFNDFLYAVFMPLTGIRAAFVKKIRWN